MEVANVESSPDFSGEEAFYLFQAIAFQRSRTALEINKTMPATEKMLLELFRHHLKREADAEFYDEFVKHLKAGNMSVTEPPNETIGRCISVALESTLGIMDLQLCLLRNRTDYPFIFSDAPVVFYNTHCINVQNRGVIGMQAPGLQIFYPLDPWTLAMLFDRDKYSGPFRGYMQYDIHNRADISQLNALQIHHSLNAVYYGDPQHEHYTSDLWQAHRRKRRSLDMRFSASANFLIDGKPPEGELMHSFEPQINHNLELSFVTCDRIAEIDYVPMPRDREIHEELRKRDRELDESK